MSHHDFIRRLASATWPGELVFGPQDAQRWDAAQYRSVNGDDGGTWNPTKPVIIGGSASPAVALTSSGSLLSGGAKTSRGGRIGLGANDFPVVTPTRTRTIAWPLWRMQTVKPQTWLDDSIAFSSGDTAFGVNPGNGVNEIAIPSKFLHHGAQLFSITVYFRIPNLPTPAQMASLAHLLITPSVAAANGTFSPGGFPNNGASTVVWSAASARALNSYTAPTGANANGLYYKATSISGTGTTGGSEPTWPTTIGATVTDNPGANQIVWACVGPVGVGTKKQLSDPATLYANGAVQSLTYQSDPAANNAISTVANYYGLIIEIGPTVILHGVKFVFTGIGDLAFE